MRKTKTQDDRLQPRNQQYHRADLEGIDLSEKDLSNHDFSQSKLKGVNLRNANLTNTNFSWSDLSDVDLRGANMSGSILLGAKFHACWLDEAIVRNCNASSAEFQIASNLSNADFSGTRLPHTKFFYAKLNEVNLSNTDLTSTAFEKCELAGADFRGAKFDENTAFAQTRSIHGAKFDRWGLESMRDYGGLSVAHRSELLIEYSVAELRKQFSGFRRWINLILIIFFVAPYVEFIFRNYLNSHLCVEQHTSAAVTCISLLDKLWQFVYTGGRFDGHFARLVAITSLYQIFYNFVRVILLFKTLQLEHEEQITQLPVHFHLTGFWRVLLEIVQWGFYVNLINCSLFCFHFLQTPVPGQR